jgi:hypothetical protein
MTVSDAFALSVKPFFFLLSPFFFNKEPLFPFLFVFLNANEKKQKIVKWPFSKKKQLLVNWIEKSDQVTTKLPVWPACNINE